MTFIKTTSGIILSLLLSTVALHAQPPQVKNLLPPNRPPQKKDNSEPGPPPANRPPSNQPPGNTPPGNQPPSTNPPGNQPPSNKPPGQQPPSNQPPGNSPPGNQPPGQPQPDGEVFGTPEQIAWAKQNDAPVEFTNSLGMTFRIIPPGEFIMGSETDDATLARLFQSKPGETADERPRHQVKLTQIYYMQITEVTQAQWIALMGAKAKPWDDKATQNMLGDHLPAFNISWNDANRFCQRLSEHEDIHYRLPTEAEWEYSCRAGTGTMFFTGNDPDSIHDHAWLSFNTFHAEEAHHQQVGTKYPNPFGLYDMHGNVSEWCLDLYHQDFYKYSPDENPIGPAPNSTPTAKRVFRGGNWTQHEFALRSSDRSSTLPSYRNSLLGFRVVIGESVATEPQSLPTDGPPANRPPSNKPPGNRPPGNSPPANQPPANRPPGNAPPANRPPGNQPPSNQPPGNSPPSNKPPVKRPPVKKAP